MASSSGAARLPPSFGPALHDRTEQLVSRIRPAGQSEYRRHGAATYMMNLITRTFAPVPVRAIGAELGRGGLTRRHVTDLSAQGPFPPLTPAPAPERPQVNARMFGSVPLRTYLPDGDIDMSIFTEHGSLKDTWASKLQQRLEEEQKNPDALFRVSDVQVINAEVRMSMEKSKGPPPNRPSCSAKDILVSSPPPPLSSPSPPLPRRDALWVGCTRVHKGAAAGQKDVRTSHRAIQSEAEAAGGGRSLCALWARAPVGTTPPPAPPAPPRTPPHPPAPVQHPLPHRHSHHPAPLPPPGHLGH
jgi:hypothetical protein